MRYPILTALAALILALGLSGAAYAGLLDAAQFGWGPAPAEPTPAPAELDPAQYGTYPEYEPVLPLGWGPAPAEDGFSAYKRGDYATALGLWRPLANQGEAAAQNNLGTMYNDGRGVPQDYLEAVKWYCLAADQGNVNAQLNLGLMYGKGRGVPQDDVQAHMWFNLAGAGGDANGRDNRDIVATKMTPAQIAEAQRLAREWKPKTSR